jgi:hypothetical protein
MGPKPDTASALWFAQSALWLYLLALPSIATEQTFQLGPCDTLDACLLIVDAHASEYSNGHSVDAREATAHLKSFGEPARRALLHRALEQNPGMRRLAIRLLRNWHEWKPSDVPVLSRILALDHEEEIAWPLAEIGNAGAITVLANDIKYCGGQSDQALVSLGSRAVPYVLPLLQDGQSWGCAASVLRQMKPSASDFAQPWTDLALDAQQPIAVRIGALRGISVIGSPARDATERLPSLLSSPHDALRKQAELTLIAVNDPAVLDSLVKSCKPAGVELDFFAMKSTWCVEKIGEFGHNAREFGPTLLPFLKSSNSDERLSAAIALGSIGYAASGTRLRAALQDKDWRVVYAAATSLGELRTIEATSELSALERSYWLSEVRNQARESLAALTSVSTPQILPRWQTIRDYEFSQELVANEKPCLSARWRWQSVEFGRPIAQSTSEDITLSFPEFGGQFVGSDHGEFGGGLNWVPDHGHPQVLYKGSGVSAIARDPNGVVAMTGTSHMGFDFGVLLITSRSTAGVWTTHELARLPAKGESMSTIANGLHAAWSRGRVIVFSDLGIQGLASCEGDPPI